MRAPRSAMLVHPEAGCNRSATVHCNAEVFQCIDQLEDNVGLNHKTGSVLLKWSHMFLGGETNKKY